MSGHARVTAGGDAPDGADGVALRDRFADLNDLRELLLGASRDGLLDEERDAGEVLEDLELDVATGLGGAAEHGRAADDDGAGHLLAGHVLDEVLERLEDARVLVRGAHERLALLLEHRRRTVDGGVDQRDALEARTEFAAGAGERHAEAECGELTDCSKRKEWFQGPSSEPVGA